MLAYTLKRFRIPICGFGLSVLGAACTHIDHPTDYVIPELTSNRDLEYQQQKQNLIERAADVNFDKLRWSFRSSSEFQEWDTLEHEAALAMFNAFEDQNYPLCLKFSQAILDINYTSISAHFGAFSCLSALGKETEAAFHRYVISGLVESIEKSGDGKTAKTAFVTISPSEMRSYIQVRGLTSYRQELVDAGARYIEKFYVIDPATDQHLELYFDNSASLIAHMRPSFE